MKETGIAVFIALSMLVLANMFNNNGYVGFWVGMGVYAVGSLGLVRGITWLEKVKFSWFWWLVCAFVVIPVYAVIVLFLLGLQ